MEILGVKNRITKTKSSLDVLNNRKEEIEERIREIKDSTVKITQSK